ncbi:hypothetical protein N7450_001539 [Penicillium hetheringtonii]|uniref:HD domain-containing protein n=1 Tax=Penicillium hetheringtonii TaxID=911720 RepID=A0AAD6E4R6_9EURO|nr:hypothetical protein N7450_001539 [Penicillium hetheringtonii]
MHTTRVFAGIHSNRHSLVRKALEFAQAHHDPISLNHIYRSWIFGTLIGSKIPSYSDFNLEIHAVSAILHDLAWDYTRVFATKSKRFEVDSVNASSDFLTRKAPEVDERQLQIVWDGIALNTTPSLARYKEIKVALCHIGSRTILWVSNFPVVF